MIVEAGNGMERQGMEDSKDTDNKKMKRRTQKFERRRIRMKMDEWMDKKNKNRRELYGWNTLHPNRRYPIRVSAPQSHPFLLIRNGIL